MDIWIGVWFAVLAGGVVAGGVLSEVSLQDRIYPTGSPALLAHNRTRTQQGYAARGVGILCALALVATWWTVR